MKKWLLAVVFALFAVTGLTAADKAWYTDYDAAQKVAAEKNLPMYLLFTGSDWCPWCVKLHNEVLEKKEFKDYTKDKVVLVYLDFPRKKKLPAKEAKQNESLSQKFNIEGFPTVIVTNAKGEKIGQLSYSPLKEHLESLKKYVEKTQK